MNFSEKLISRAGYTFLDYLSDIGGMQGLLISGVSYFVSFWNYNYFDNYMVTRLFKIKKKKCQDVDNCEQGPVYNTSPSRSQFKHYFHKSEFMRPRKGYNPKEYIIDLLPTRCKKRYCRADRLETGFVKAREALQKEINFVEMLKQQRFVKNALKILLSREQRMELKERCRYICIDPDYKQKSVKDSSVSQTNDKNQVDDADKSDEMQFTSGFFSSD